MECCSARNRHGDPQQSRLTTPRAAADSPPESWRDSLRNGGETPLLTPRDNMSTGNAQVIVDKALVNISQSGSAFFDLDHWAQQLEAKVLKAVQDTSQSNARSFIDMKSADESHKEQVATLQEQVDRLEKFSQELSSRQFPVINELHTQLHKDTNGSMLAAGSLYEQLRDMDRQQKDTTLDLLVAVIFLKDTTLRRGIRKLIHAMDEELGSLENDQAQHQDRSQTDSRKKIESSSNSELQRSKREASVASLDEVCVGLKSPHPELSAQFSGLSGLSGDKGMDDKTPRPAVHGGPSSASLTTASDIVSKESNRSTGPTSVLGKLEDSQEQQVELVQGVKLEKLRESLEKTEAMYKAAEFGRQPVLRKSLSQFVLSVDNHQRKDAIIDVAMGVIILLNSVVIGISLDYDVLLVDVIGVIFSLCFIAELCAKFYLHGAIKHLSSASNIFDSCLVAVDIFQLILDLMKIGWLAGTPSAAMFRIVRLLPLVRLLRLIRLDAFEDLVAMIVGILGGVKTLMWAMVLFSLMLYITSLLFRELFGNKSYLIPSSDGEDMAEYFNSVPRSMLTVFRFFFGDFTTAGGVSLLESLTIAHGTFYGVLVSVLYFAVFIGLFNVIAAIFVESTFAGARQTAISKKNERMNDEILWMTRITLLVRKLYEHSGEEVPEKMSAQLEQIKDKPIPEQHFSEFMKDPDVLQSLTDLEIDPKDHRYLFDILDCENTGAITVCEMADGLERLRGDARRSDIICIDLMLRSIQEQTNFLTAAAKANVRTSSGNKKFMQKIENMLEKLALTSGA